jgi:hypothetical protein
MLKKSMHRIISIVHTKINTIVYRFAADRFFFGDFESFLAGDIFNRVSNFSCDMMARS